jgi:hypothetical protein
MHIKITDPATYPASAKALVDLWGKFKTENRNPVRSDLTAKTLQRWLGEIDVYEVENDGTDFRIRSSGEEITKTTHEDWWGRTARDVDAIYNTQLHADMTEVYQSGTPSVHHIKVFQSHRKSTHRVLLPIYDDVVNSKITMIFLCFTPNTRLK